MKIIVAIDEDCGMMFNHRRQSQDKVLRERVLSLSQHSVLWMNPYSGRQFKESTGQVRISESFLQDAGAGEYCFVEDLPVLEYASEIEEVILFRWNRRYPGDFKLDFLPWEQGMKCLESEDFKGNSHEKITMEVWGKDGN